MNEQFVTVTIPKFFTDFRQQMEDLRDDVTEETAPILRRAEEASIRARWYRLGRTLRSLRDDTQTEGQKRVYRLEPTAAHAIFGEFGTGRRGARTGRPAPKGYRYGDRPGMEARRYSRIAVQEARPKVMQAAQNVVKDFARNVTVK